jgi:hypothetical protein
MLRVAVPAAGTLRVIGTRPTTRLNAERRGASARTVRTCAAVKRVTKASTVTIYCIPNRTTRALLATRSVRVTLRVTFTTEAGSSTGRTVRLTLPKRGISPQPVTG